MTIELVSVPAIATIVYWIINLIKYTINYNEKFKRFIPLTAALLGVILGVVCFYGLPTILPTDNLLVAIVIGGSSGLTATGFNQVLKQMREKEVE